MYNQPARGYTVCGAVFLSIVAGGFYCVFRLTQTAVVNWSTYTTLSKQADCLLLFVLTTIIAIIFRRGVGCLLQALSRYGRRLALPAVDELLVSAYWESMLCASALRAHRSVFCQHCICVVSMYTLYVLVSVDVVAYMMFCSVVNWHTDWTTAQFLLIQITMIGGIAWTNWQAMKFWRNKPVAQN